MDSPDSDFSAEAVRKLMACGWGFVTDGSLERVDLHAAALECANLEPIRLEGANLWGANLKGANLEGANPENAKVSGKQ